MRDDDEPKVQPYADVIARHEHEKRLRRQQTYESLSHYLDVQFEARMSEQRSGSANVGFSNLKRRP